MRPARPTPARPPLNGLTLLALIALAVGIVIAWRAGRIAGRREARAPAAARAPAVPAPAASAAVPSPGGAAAAPEGPGEPPAGDTTYPDERASLDAERSRIALALEAENARLRAEVVDLAGRCAHLRELAEDRRALLASVADARAETARYRALVVEAENNAPSNLLDGPGSPDDLKLVVGIGPMLERMLHQLHVTTYRQIAHWSERDIDEIDAKLPEFPGRIRRDQWVVQARALHRSKYGETP